MTPKPNTSRTKTLQTTTTENAIQLWKDEAVFTKTVDSIYSAQSQVSGMKPNTAYYTVYVFQIFGYLITHVSNLLSVIILVFESPKHQSFQLCSGNFQGSLAIFKWLSILLILFKLFQSIICLCLHQTVTLENTAIFSSLSYSQCLAQCVTNK